MRIIDTDYIHTNDHHQVIVTSIPSAGSYGYGIRFNTGVYFEDGENVEIVCKRPDGTMFRREVKVLINEEGYFLYTVKKGDFTVGGTYCIQFIQESDDSRIISNVFRLGVARAMVDFDDDDETSSDTMSSDSTSSD